MSVQAGPPTQVRKDGPTSPTAMHVERTCVAYTIEVQGMRDRPHTCSRATILAMATTSTLATSAKRATNGADEDRACL